MNKIDTTKPLELSDGTPVTLKRVCPYTAEIWVNVPAPHKMNGEGCIFEANGKRLHMYGNSNLHLRNRAIFSVGQTVYFRNGRTGVVVATPTQFGTSYIQAAVVGGVITTDTFKAVLAYQNGLQSIDGTWESENDFATTPDAFKPKVTFTFRNVYQDGTAGSTAHKSFDVAKIAAKVGKTRVGILKIGTDGSTELLKCVPSKRLSGFEVAVRTDA